MNTNMSSKRRLTGAKDNNSFSLIYTLNAISHLNKEEFELLKKLRRDKATYQRLKENETNMPPMIQKILDDFHVESIEEVIQMVEDFKIFELYDF